MVSFDSRLSKKCTYNVGRDQAKQHPAGWRFPADSAGCACSARIGLQADAAIPARTMVREFPVSP
jgi:hypothetical protein